MSAPQFTSGPWSFDGPPDNHIVWSAPEMRVCFLTSNGPTTANARLIAAAPLLYADAEFLCARIRDLESDLADDETGRQYYGHVVPALARMESALREARGDQ